MELSMSYGSASVSLLHSLSFQLVLFFHPTTGVSWRSCVWLQFAVPAILRKSGPLLFTDEFPNNACDDINVLIVLGLPLATYLISCLWHKSFWLILGSTSHYTDFAAFCSNCALLSVLNSSIWRCVSICLFINHSSSLWVLQLAWYLHYCDMILLLLIRICMQIVCLFQFETL